MKTVAFFNNKGGVGKTTLVYQLAWMFAEIGVKTIAADLDPQSNLSSAFLSEDRCAELWNDENLSGTISGAINPLLNHLGDISNDPPCEQLDERLTLITGDLALSLFEDRLAGAWNECLSDNPANAADAFRVMTAFYRVMNNAATLQGAEVVLIDVGPNLGALNRAALVAADYVVVPMGADLFSLQGLRNLGPRLREWSAGWQKRRGENVPQGLLLPSGMMKPVGYVLMQPSMRKDRPVKAYQNWANRIPAVYRACVMGIGEPQGNGVDENCLATLKHYRSLMPLAQDANKPMFFLKPADGAIGNHALAVRDCFDDFKGLAHEIARRIGIHVADEEVSPQPHDISQRPEQLRLI